MFKYESRKKAEKEKSEKNEMKDLILNMSIITLNIKSTATITTRQELAEYFLMAQIHPFSKTITLIMKYRQFIFYKAKA